MFAFELTDQAAVLENFNTRTEKVGNDKVPAADLKLSCAMNADVLAFFAPTLKAMLFKEEADLAGGTLALRDAHMVYPLSRDEEMTGATLTIDYGVKDKMIFADAKVNTFKIEPREGGSVLVGFRVQCRPDEQQAGRLYMLHERAVTVSLAPPEWVTR